MKKVFILCSLAAVSAVFADEETATMEVSIEQEVAIGGCEECSSVSIESVSISIETPSIEVPSVEVASYEAPSVETTSDAIDAMEAADDSE